MHYTPSCHMQLNILKAFKNFNFVKALSKKCECKKSCQASIGKLEKVFKRKNDKLSDTIRKTVFPLYNLSVSCYLVCMDAVPFILFLKTSTLKNIANALCTL